MQPLFSGWLVLFQSMHNSFSIEFIVALFIRYKGVLGYDQSQEYYSKFCILLYSTFFFFPFIYNWIWFDITYTNMRDTVKIKGEK